MGQTFLVGAVFLPPLPLLLLFNHLSVVVAVSGMVFKNDLFRGGTFVVAPLGDQSLKIHVFHDGGDKVVGFRGQCDCGSVGVGALMELKGFWAGGTQSGACRVGGAGSGG